MHFCTGISYMHVLVHRHIISTILNLLAETNFPASNFKIGLSHACSFNFRYVWSVYSWICSPFFRSFCAAVTATVYFKQHVCLCIPNKSSSSSRMGMNPFYLWGDGLMADQYDDTEPTFVENIIDLAFSILCNSYNISMCIYTHRVSFQSEILCHIQVNNKYFNMNYCTFCACVKMERQLGDDSWPYRHRC